MLFLQSIAAQVKVEVRTIDEVYQDTARLNTELREMFPRSIEEILEQQNISFKINSPYILTSNKQCFPCEEKGCALRGIINCAYAGIAHQDSLCEVYLVTSYKSIHGNPEIIPDFMGDNKNMSIYNRIKRDLDWSVINIPKYANKYEIEELKLLMTNYPNKLARKYFNADYMLMYPLNTRRQKCRDKFSRGRCVVIGKDYRFVFMYFLMTDDSVVNFDQYLSQFSKMIWFN